jgi:hypothetical protein
MPGLLEESDPGLDFSITFERSAQDEFFQNGSAILRIARNICTQA